MGEAAILSLIETAGPIAAGIAIVLLVLFFGLKVTGFTTVLGSREKVMAGDGLAELVTQVKGIDAKLNNRLEALEDRLVSAEASLDHKASREELHELKLAMVRYEGELQVQKQIATQTNAALLRIEGYMYDYSVARHTAVHWPGRRPKESE